VSRQDKVIKFAQEMYNIPKIRKYLMSTTKISRVRVEGLLSTYLNFNDNNAFQELVDGIILIAETNRAFLE